MVKLPTRQTHRRVLVFGTFDVFHPGHRSFFRQAKKLGAELIVAVGRDNVVARLKKRAARHDERYRLARVEAEPLVDRAILASRDPRRRYAFIRSLKPDVIALGYDQTHYTKNLPTELKKRGIKALVIRLRSFRPHLYKSSLFRDKASGVRPSRKTR